MFTNEIYLNSIGNERLFSDSNSLKYIKAKQYKEEEGSLLPFYHLLYLLVFCGRLVERGIQ